MARAEVAGRLDDAFARGRAEGRALLMPFLVCGYPDGDTFVGLARAAAEAGADVLEVGIPFSDPIMDGPVIQQASQAVLARGLRTADALDLVARAASASGVPIVVMTYYNLVFRHGGFGSAVASAGAAGVIVPDLSIEDAGPWLAEARAAGVAPVFIAAPTSPPERLRALGEASEGFVYAASLLGVTGVREEMSKRARALVSSLREVTSLPVAVGIGVSTTEHAREVATYADGVIVGSALVRRIAGAAEPVEAARAFVGELRDAVTR